MEDRFMMKKRSFDIAENADDLAGLEVGTAILTRRRQILELDVIEGDREDSGTLYWIEPGTLEPHTVPLGGWFPAIVLRKRPKGA